MISRAAIAHNADCNKPLSKLTTLMPTDPAFSAISMRSPSFGWPRASYIYWRYWTPESIDLSIRDSVNSLAAVKDEIFASEEDRLRGY
jgi:hypothetical protein